VVKTLIVDVLIIMLQSRCQHVDVPI